MSASVVPKPSSSTSDFQQSCLALSPDNSHRSTVENAEGLSARKEQCSSILLEEVNPIWLDAAPSERYLLLEDAHTGDILMPLVYMKAVFEVNYSRKMSALKHRLVIVPPCSELDDSGRKRVLYWQWAFEAPQNVKTVVRRELGADNTPNGHIRLILLPIVYNAMASKSELCSTPLFQALEAAMRQSTYHDLLQHAQPKPEEEDCSARATSVSSDGRSAMGDGQPVFHGPRSLGITAIKYMCDFKDCDLGNKRARKLEGQGSGRLGVEDGQLMEVQRELEVQRRRCEKQQEQIGSLCAELENVKAGLLGIYRHFPSLQPKSPERQLQPRDLQKTGNQGSVKEEDQPASSLMEETVQERFSHQSIEEDLSQTGPSAWQTCVPIESPHMPSGVLFGNDSMGSASSALQMSVFQEMTPHSHSLRRPPLPHSPFEWDTALTSHLLLPPWGAPNSSSAPVPNTFLGGHMDGTSSSIGSHSRSMRAATLSGYLSLPSILPQATDGHASSFQQLF